MAWNQRSTADGLAVAKLSGAVQYLTTGPGRDLPYAQKITELREITTNP